MYFAFKVRAASKDSAKAAVDALLTEQAAGCNSQAAAAAAHALIDGIPLPADGEEMLICVNGTTKSEERHTEDSIGCSVYLVPKEEQPVIAPPAPSPAPTSAPVAETPAAPPAVVDQPAALVLPVVEMPTAATVDPVADTAAAVVQPIDGGTVVGVDPAAAGADRTVVSEQA